MTQLADLLARLEKAEGPDREIDAALLVALLKPEQLADDLRYYRLPSPSMDHMEMCAPGTYWLKQRSGASLHTSPHYTASLDAALALVERVLPSREWCVGVDLENSCAWAQVENDVWDEATGHIRGKANTPALALLAALLRAKIAEARQ